MDDKKNIPWARPDYWGNETAYVMDSLQSAWISGGPYVQRLEEHFSKCLDVRHALVVSNGTTAIHLAYLGLGLKPGDEVIVPGFAFMAAANVALHMYLKPVFVEVDPKTWCMDPNAIEKAITPKTKVIIPVHTYGNVCAMDPIMEIARAHHVPVMEDCAESLFSRYKGAYCGTLGAVNTFSFHATKTITTGEGGMVVCNDDAMKGRMALYRSHGAVSGKYRHEVPGHNFRMTNFQAALGCAQFEQKDRIIEARRRMFQSYQRLLRDVPGFTIQEFTPEVDPVVWAIALKLDQSAFPQGRDGLMQQLKEKGIETRPGFYASSLQSIYEKHALPVCEDVCLNVISLPGYPTLEDETIAYIVSELIKLKR